MGRPGQEWSKDAGSYEWRKNGWRQKRMKGDNGSGNGPKWPRISKKKKKSSILILLVLSNFELFVFILSNNTQHARLIVSLKDDSKRSRNISRENDFYKKKKKMRIRIISYMSHGFG